MSIEYLKNLHFSSYLIQDVDFISKEYRPGSKGRVNYGVERTGNVEFDSNSDKAFDILMDEVTLVLGAKNYDQETQEYINDAFDLNARFYVIYFCPKGKVSDGEKIINDESTWYFRNYAHQCAHEIFTSIIEKTVFKAATKYIPSFRIDRDEDM